MEDGGFRSVSRMLNVCDVKKGRRIFAPTLSPDWASSSSPRYMSPCSSIAVATFLNPAMFAPTTKLPFAPYSSAADEDAM